MHADYPVGRGLFMGRICPSGSLMVAHTVAFPRLMHRYSASWVSPCWYWGCGLETIFLFYYYSVGVPEASTPLPCRLLLVSLPTVSLPTMSPSPRSLLPVDIGGWHHPAVSASWSEPSQRPTLVNTRGRSTPEASQRLGPS